MDTFKEFDPLLRTNGATTENDDITDFLQWTPKQLTAHLENNGVSVGDTFVKHKISGDVIGLLSDSDYQRMGIESVGDCIRLKRAVEVLQRKAKIVFRSVTIWEADEYIIPSLCEYLVCDSLCKSGGDTYKLTNSFLHITYQSNVYCCCGSIGPLQGCCASILRKLEGTHFHTETIPLVSIRDLEIVTHTPSLFQSCCGIVGQDQIVVTAQHSENSSNQSSTTGPLPRTYTIRLKKGSAARVVQLMREVMAETIAKM